MKCSEYRIAYARYAESPPGYASEAPEEYAAFVAHTERCSDCDAWFQGAEVQRRGFRVEDFPCVHMAYRITERLAEQPDPFLCPERIVVYVPMFDDYGIPVHDGGEDVISITHCPWCGIALPAGKREVWVKELRDLGIEQPDEEDIPKEYLSDEWWRRKNS